MPTLSVTAIGLIVAVFASVAWHRPFAKTLLFGIVGAWVGFGIGALAGVAVDVVAQSGAYVAIVGHVIAAVGAYAAVGRRFIKHSPGKR